MKAILKHELSLYYHGMAGYVFGAFLLLFTGIGALIYNINASVANFEYVLQFISMVYIIIVPILTMRIIAEEKKLRTDQLLYSLPISTTEIVVGKFLSLMVVFAVPMVFICFYPILFSRFGDVYLPTAYGSIVAFYLLGLMLMSVGMFISSLTESQGMAAGISVAAMLFIYFMQTLLGFLPWPEAWQDKATEIINALAPFNRFDTFVSGVFDLTAVFYYISLTAFFLFLTVQSLDKRRYKG